MAADHVDVCGPHHITNGVLFGMGNPLLDICVTGDQDLLDKYNLKADDQILAEPSHLPLFTELSDSKDVEFLAGGATQNAMKVAQWLSQKPNTTIFMGCIGKDKFGEILNEKASAVGVSAHYQYDEKEATGTAACIITGSSRSLVANLAAANHFTKNHLDESQHWEMVTNAKYYYIAGFFLTVSPPSIMEVAKHSLSNKKTFMMNLSAPFISQFFKDPLMAAMPYVDILFGNESEAAAFSTAMDFGTEDVKEIAMKAAALPKEDEARSRIVVFTQGALPTIVVENGVATEYPVIPLQDGELVDTNGAGDAFVGGFLAQLIQKHPIAECIRCANYAANVIIKRAGCTFPEKPDYN
ncbi:adenosine kinase-like [Watersipora subatra]|uniref:adenosine kinase-like n=1 Tax=Watersipora subatra TaxID=2589382 RepID=UPI00355BE3BE